MNLIKVVEINENVPRKFKLNFPYNSISEKLKENLKDTYIKRLIKPILWNFDVQGNSLGILQEEETEEYNLHLKDTPPFNFKDIKWKISIKFYLNQKKYILKTNIHSYNDLLKNKIELNTYDCFLKIFFKEKELWNSSNPNSSLIIDKNRIVHRNNNYTWYHIDFRWEYYFELKQLETDLNCDLETTVIPFISLNPIIPEDTDYNFYQKMKIEIENLNKEYLLNLYEELIKISYSLKVFKLIYFEGPSVTFIEEFDSYIDDIVSLQENLDSDTRRYPWEE